MTRSLIFALTVLSFSCTAQEYTSARIFAHNDYVQEKPFYTAYDLGVGYIEADVFLEEDQLMVAHHKEEIKNGRTLDSMYLAPLLEKVLANGGLVYPDKRKTLTLMIDLKTEGVTTLDAVVAALQQHTPLLSCPNLQFMISGSVPDRGTWSRYPAYIFFDGRPGIDYTNEQLARIRMISTNFRQHVSWDGHTPLSSDDRLKILALKDAANKKGKPFRFWAAPDFPAAWEVLVSLDMDVIHTDNVEALARFFREKPR